MIPPPELLYHYTSFAGLEGIVKSRSLWASSIHYLNDASEFQEARLLALEIIDGILLPRASDDVERTILGSLRSQLTEPSEVRVCVFSLSSNRNQLSQWRAYCPGGRGVSIGFDVRSLSDISAQAGFRLVQCVYDLQSQRKAIEAAIVSGVKFLRDAGKPIVETAGSNAMRWFFQQVAPTIKNLAFREEDEWRLVSGPIRSDDPHLRVRATASMLVPYFELPIELSDRRIPIAEICVGPTNHLMLSVSAVRDLLETARVKWGGTIVPSHVPLREGW